MKNKLISLLAISLVLTELTGCVDAPIIKKKAFIPPSEIERAYLQLIPDFPKKPKIAQCEERTYETCNCPDNLSTLYGVHRLLEVLTELELYSFKQLKTNPNDSWNKRDLEFTQDYKKDLMGCRGYLLDSIKDCKCFEKLPREKEK